MDSALILYSKTFFFKKNIPFLSNKIQLLNNNNSLEFNIFSRCQLLFTMLLLFFFFFFFNNKKYFIER